LEIQIMTNSNSRRGGIILGLALTVLGLVCAAVVVAIVVARNVRVDSVHGRGGDDVSIETPAGHFSIHAHEQSGMALVDVPEYPGARRKKHSGGGAVFEWTWSDGHDDKGFSVSGDEMITDDRADKVLEYYKAQLPNWAVSHQGNGEIHIELAKRGYKRFVVIHEKFDGTHIGVASIGSPAAN
jgi:hypothetical protein